jgi:predicted trehalose synthase
MDTDNTRKPKKDSKDVARSVVKAALSCVPALGGPMAEIFSLVVAPSLEKRRDAWIESLAARLKELEDRVSGFSVENLCGNESFVSVLMQASNTAIKNHQKEKREALSNAI